MHPFDCTRENDVCFSVSDGVSVSLLFSLALSFSPSSDIKNRKKSKLKIPLETAPYCLCSMVYTSRS